MTEAKVWHEAPGNGTFRAYCASCSWTSPVSEYDDDINRLAYRHLADEHNQTKS